jgi:anti-anti-sigma regulatory factor
MGVVHSRIAGEADTVLVVVLPATLTDDTAGPVLEEVKARLPNCDGAAVVFDCGQVEMINSIGITCLLQAQDECRRRGAAFVLAAVPTGIMAFLARLKLDQRFPRHASVEEAVAAVDGRGAP